MQTLKKNALDFRGYIQKLGYFCAHSACNKIKDDLSIMRLFKKKL